LLHPAYAVRTGKWAQYDALIKAVYVQFVRVEVPVNNADAGKPGVIQHHRRAAPGRWRTASGLA